MPFVAFQAVSCAAFSLSPHIWRFAASTLVARYPTNTRKTSEMRAIVYPPSITVLSAPRSTKTNLSERVVCFP